MAEEEGVAGQEWKGICVSKYGWSLRLKQKSRNIVYLGPGEGCFMVSFVLSDKALKAAKELHLPKAVADALDSAGAPVKESPRAMLMRQIARLDGLGLRESVLEYWCKLDPQKVLHGQIWRLTTYG
jgi:hypothetical protein